MARSRAWAPCSSPTRWRRCATSAGPSCRAAGCTWSSGGARSTTTGCIAPRPWSSGSWSNEDSDEPTCGPGPFALADADVASQILVGAGFDDVALRRCDIPIRIGADIDEAVAYICSLGPAGELIRLAGDEADRRRPEIEAALRKALAAYERHGGIVAPASAWIVTARAGSSR